MTSRESVAVEGRSVGTGPVTVVGSINLDLMVWAPDAPAAGELVFGDDFQLLLGGKGANVAAQISRSQGEVRLAACVGDDALGDLALRALDEQGLGTDDIRRVATHTGVGHVHVDTAGEYRSIVVPGANAYSPATGSELIKSVSSSAAVVLQFEAAPDARADLLSWRPRSTVIYLNPSPWTVTSEAELSGADVLVCNELEARNSAQLLVPAVAEGPLEEIGAALAGVVAEVVITRGAHGALAWGDGGAATSHPGFVVKAVGTIGAGDAFLGEYVTARAAGVPLERSLERACAAGALATLEAGPTSTLVTRERIDELVKTGQ